MKTASPVYEIPSHFVHRPDGTRIRYFDSGGERPALVLANGLGGPLAAFRPHLAELLQRFRVLTWDYRGTYASLLGPNPDLGVEAHSSDLGAVLDAANVNRADFIGWSMGVQVGLELYRERPELFERLVFMNGTFGAPLHGVALPLSRHYVPGLVDGARRLHFLGGPLLAGLGKGQLAPRMLKKLGLVAPTFDLELLGEVIESFKSLDFDVYFRLLRALGDHDGTAVLPDVQAPVLVITGSKDFLTPPAAARRMTRLMPDAQLFVVQGASHYAAAEFPQLILDRILHFFDSRPPEPTRASGTAAIDMHDSECEAPSTP